VVAGKITDADGDPLENVQIQLLRTIYNQGRKQLQPYGSGNTNDLGEYRISGIVPGKYYLWAVYRARRMFGPLDSAGDAGPQDDYVPAYYPGVTDPQAASTIDIQPGDQMQGINIRMIKMRTVRVLGHVVDNTSVESPRAQAGPSAGARPINMPVNGRIQVRLLPRNSLTSNGMNMINGIVRADGSFEFSTVPAGSYYLIASNYQAGRAGGHAAKQSLEVGNADLQGVSIAINQGAEIHGRVRYDGVPPSALPSLSVRLSPRETNGGMLPFPQPARVEEDGSFHFDNLNFDVYTVNINPPQGLYVKTIRSGNKDVMIAGLDLSNGASPLDILIGSNPPQVGGQVVNAETGQPAIAVTVVLVPQEEERQEQAYFYQTTNSDQYGNFTLSRVTPGEYQVYAWDDVQDGQWFDPDWMKAYEGKGKILTAKEGSSLSLQLTVISAK
jgi:hypothetical protein